MELWKLLREEVKHPNIYLVVFIIISGISNAALIGVINKAVHYTSIQTINHELLIIFLLLLGVFLYTKQYVLNETTRIVENVMKCIRYRIVNKIRYTELSTLEKLGSSTLYARITQDVGYISSVSSSIISAGQASIMVLFTLSYIAFISVASFLVVIIGLGIIGFVYLRNAKQFHKMWKSISIKETVFFQRLGYILQGFKEIKLNRLKNEAVFNNFTEVNSMIEKERTKVRYKHNANIIFAEAFFYFLLASVIFILPVFHAEDSDIMIKITATLLFMIGSFQSILTTIPFVDNANNSAINIIQLEKELEEELSKLDGGINSLNQPLAYETLDFNTSLELRNLTYTYPFNPKRNFTFTLEPITFTFRPGEIVFITGGNGSGKSTFLKLLTGLYPPQSGEILLDIEDKGKPKSVVKPILYQQYRNLFTSIFTDFHLFDRLYGIEKIEEKKVNDLIQDMGLKPEITRFHKEQFTSIHLSSGQKKRLALATSILEDKPIYIFDEVASDLDPEFRDRYYRKILPALKKQNKLVIVVSHDQFYWDVPDRLLRMVDGKIKEFSKEEIATLVKMNK